MNTETRSNPATRTVTADEVFTVLNEHRSQQFVGAGTYRCAGCSEEVGSGAAALRAHQAEKVAALIAPRVLCTSCGGEAASPGCQVAPGVPGGGHTFYGGCEQGITASAVRP